MESLNQDAPVVQRARLGALWEAKRSKPVLSPKKKTFFLSADLFGFCRFFVLVTLSRFSRMMTITFLLPDAWLTGCRLAPNFEPTCTISLPTPLHLPCAVCALTSPPNSGLHPAPSLFFVPSRHWIRCFDGSGSVFRAVFACAGPPQSPLPTCTPTLLTLLSFFFCVQSSGRYSSTPPFWADADKAQNKVRNQVFLPYFHCRPLASIHPHCFAPLPLILSHI
jgi:hypothetical protein